MLPQGERVRRTARGLQVLYYAPSMRPTRLLIGRRREKYEMDDERAVIFSYGLSYGFLQEKSRAGKRRV